MLSKPRNLLISRSRGNAIVSRHRMAISATSRHYYNVLRGNLQWRWIVPSYSHQLETYQQRCYSYSLSSSSSTPSQLLENIEMKMTSSSLVPSQIAPKLINHVDQLLQQTIETHLLSDNKNHNNDIIIGRDQITQIAKFILQSTLEQQHQQLVGKAITSNQDYFELADELSKIIPTIPSQELLHLTNSSPQDISIKINQWRQNYQEAKNQNVKIFETISNHHLNIAKNANDWSVNVKNQDSLQLYSQAATSMGKKIWVKESNEWMADFLMSYYRFGGARKYFCKKHGIGKYDAQDGRYYSLSKDLMSMDSNINNVEGVEEGDLSREHNNNSKNNKNNKKIRILDVGSCYNPLQASLHATSSFDITAIDLFPADNSVFRCDFLNLQIGPMDSKPIIDYDPIMKKKSILQLPAHSFDAITMSLVLSYLPSPSQREEMIQKARQLLITPSPPYPIDASVNPHYSGLLLIVEKESIFGRNHDEDVIKHLQGSTIFGEWKKSISECGFDLVKYNLLPAKDGHRSHTFAFATIPDVMDNVKSTTAGEQGADFHPKAKYRMWIKQDFTRQTSSIRTAITSQDESISMDNSMSNCKSNSSKLNNKKTVSTPTLLTYNDLYLPVGIVGGGIGGTALALSLQHHGIPFYLFEKDIDFASRRQGYALTMQQGGIALRELDVVQEVIDEGAISVIHYSYDAKGKVIGAYGAGKRGDMTSFDPSLVAQSPSEIKQRHNIHLPRQKLREILMKKVNPESIQWNKKFIAFDSNPDEKDMNSMSLKFHDDSHYDVSIVVGADGVFSSVRQQILSSSPDITSKFQPLSYLNLIVILGISDQRSTVDGQHLCARQWLDGQNRIFSMPYDKNKTMWQMSFPMSEEEAMKLSSWGKRSDDEMISIGQKLKQEALKRCHGWDPALINILLSTRDGDISGHPVYDRNPELGLLPRSIQTSSKIDQLTMPPRVTLLGDAVHPMSPFKGQGANQALLDALHLSRALLSSDLAKEKRRPIIEALHDFEQDMLFRSRPKVLKSRDAALYLHSEAALVEGNITRAKAAQLLYKNCSMGNN